LVPVPQRGLVLCNGAVLRTHFDDLSAFRPCGCDLVEFFNSTSWA